MNPRCVCQTSCSRDVPNNVFQGNTWIENVVEYMYMVQKSRVMKPEISSLSSTSQKQKNEITLHRQGEQSVGDTGVCAIYR